MAEFIEITETYWSICWKWFVPYPCRKRRTVKKWHYYFDFLNVSYRYFYTNYNGCELNIRYKWRRWEFPMRSEDFTLYGKDMYFDNQLSSNGVCNPVDNPID